MDALLQGFIDTCFENVPSTEYALNLLQQFQLILKRDSFQENLNAKYLVIFQNYGKDVDTIQQLYESKKNGPPLPRNAPLVAGDASPPDSFLKRSTRT